MIEREILTPEKANALLQYQDALQAEAHNVLTDLHLLDLLATVGPVRPLGSFVHGLMVWRDIDLSVATPGVQIEQLLSVVQPLFIHPGVKGVRYLKDVGHFNPTADPIHDRHYFGVYYHPSPDVEWKIDISFWLCEEHPEPVHDMLLAQNLDQEKRLAILWLKNIWYRLPAYRTQVFSVDIYDAVLEQGVRTPAELDAYLAARGKPTRTDSA